jgi:aromatic ring hydroxylase
MKFWSLRPEDKDYAVAFAIPGDWDGLKQVVTIHSLREREHYQRGFMPGSTDSYMIFENCFIPWERVFLAGEWQHGGVNALLFALFHRHSYSGCKPAIGDVILGAAALAAEVNNIHKESHVREKLAEIIMVTELGYAAGYTASDLGGPQVFMPGKGFVPYGPGSFIPHSIYCNVGRCLSGESVWRESEILCDISGGVAAQIHKTQSQYVFRRSGTILALSRRFAVFGNRRYSQHRRLSWRRFADYGADCHYHTIRYRIAQEAGQIHGRHEWRRSRGTQ